MTTSPQAYNSLSPVGFTFSLARAPNLSFTAQEVALPGVSLAGVRIPTPITSNKVPGDRIEYDELTLTFLVDENMENWLEIYRWIEALASAQDRITYRTLLTSDLTKQTVSDGVLTVLTSMMNPNVKVHFKDLLPVSLGPVQFSAMMTDIPYATCTVSFQYTYYQIEVVK